jgi:hypothetical protein
MNLQEHRQEHIRESLVHFCRVHQLYDGHLGTCDYCNQVVYWGRNRNGRWAPPFESMVRGDARPGEWVRHRERCPHVVGVLGMRTDLRPRLIKKGVRTPQERQ